MAQLNVYMAWVLDALKKYGGQSTWEPWWDEGPRRIGLCIYCHGVCNGVTTECETRVWQDAKVTRK